MGRTRASAAILNRLHELSTSQAQLAKKLERSPSWVSQSLLSDAEKAIRLLEPKAVQTLLAALDWDASQLTKEAGLRWDVPLPRPNIFSDEVTLDNPDLRKHTRPIPVYDLVSAGPGGDGGDIIEWIDIPESWSGDYAGYVVQGTSMMPTIPSGSIVVVERQSWAEQGDVIVCYSPSDGMLVKEHGGMVDAATTKLVSHNSEYRPILAERIGVIGVVVEVRRSLRKIKKNGLRHHCFSGAHEAER